MSAPLRKTTAKIRSYQQHVLADLRYGKNGVKILVFFARLVHLTTASFIKENFFSDWIKPAFVAFSISCSSQQHIVELCY
ncbi:hypothetical protein NPIL_131651 [Nephila pilipes]|uniref:Uncharacterized protein n=1 Tax=Nephila pilipes TaxID=299642 RepID=A0A8X6QG09_NEPPI|nr:hypothetical protein NPIL_131651 [Nephila pilipes]